MTDGGRPFQEMLFYLICATGSHGYHRPPSKESRRGGIVERSSTLRSPRPAAVSRRPFLLRRHLTVCLDVDVIVRLQSVKLVGGKFGAMCQMDVSLVRADAGSMWEIE